MVFWLLDILLNTITLRTHGEQHGERKDILGSPLLINQKVNAVFTKSHHTQLFENIIQKQQQISLTI